MLRPLLLLFTFFFFLSCGKKGQESGEKTQKIVQVPDFSSDSAYFFVEKQVKFGPRIPNSPAHRQAGDFLIAKLTGFGGKVVVQEFESSSFDGKKLFLRNIIASFSPEKPKRVLLAAHWDTRPFSDKDPNAPTKSFDGANDGASGVGVLLEIARVVGKVSPETGVDIILFDGEDYGERHGHDIGEPTNGLASWWCLGSQYWAKHKHRPNYTAYYGILLDMVGAKGAHFFQEGNSMNYAPKVVEKVWSSASRLGKSSLFVQQNVGAITDDHVFVNEWAKIPMIDIIPFDPSGSFGDYHHTQKDNMTVIDKGTLRAVGEVLLNVIYYED